MKIKRYYFTEARKELEKRIDRLNKSEDITDKEEIIEIAQNIFDKIERSLPETVTIINPKRCEEFEKMAELAEDIAMEQRLNLMIDMEDLTGCISFVGDSILVNNDGLMKLAEMSDEVNIRNAADTGMGLPTDEDNAVQLDFWVDCYDNL